MSFELVQHVKSPNADDSKNKTEDYTDDYKKWLDSIMKEYAVYRINQMVREALKIRG